MYLLQTKAVTLLFMALIFINIPVYLFFYASNGDQPTRVQDFFMKVSLGNIGGLQNSCVSVNWATANDASLSCGSSFSQLAELEFIGIAIDDETTCTTFQELSKESQVADQLDVKCRYVPENIEDSLFSETGIELFKKEYEEKCLGNSTCKIEVQDYLS
jgi:hypothetical protein